jgi:hypothetical protein
MNILKMIKRAQSRFEPLLSHYLSCKATAGMNQGISAINFMTGSSAVKKKPAKQLRRWWGQKKQPRSAGLCPVECRRP